MKDVRLNSKGEVMFTSIRQHPKLMEMWLAAHAPEKYGKDGGDGNVTITVVRVAE